MRNEFTHTDPDALNTNMGNLEWLDRQIRMRWLHKYQEVKRDHRLETQALKNTIYCKTYKARLRPQVCMLRKRLFPYKPCLDCKSGVHRMQKGVL